TARNPEVRPHDAVALLARARNARGRLTGEQLDAMPPQALMAEHDQHDNRDDRTSVIPRALTVPRPLPVNEDEGADPVHHTSRFTSPPLPPGRRTALWHRPTAIAVAVLLVLGLGAGVWYINSGQFTKVPPLLTKTGQQARDRL